MPLLEGDRQLQLAADHHRQQAFVLLGAAQLLQQAAGVDLRLQVGLQAQAAAQLGHDQHVVHAAAAEAAVGLGEGHAAEAQLAQLLPELAAEARLAAVEVLALLEAVAVAHQTGHGVLQHLLLFGQFEVHGVLSYRSRIILEMMFFWISLEPP
ncbi:hypothetical protein D3C84_291860 [compost metagenome]